MVVWFPSEDSVQSSGRTRTATDDERHGSPSIRLNGNGIVTYREPLGLLLAGVDPKDLRP